MIESEQPLTTTSAVRPLIQPSRGPRNESWRYLLNMVIITIIWIIGTTVLMLPFFFIYKSADLNTWPPFAVFLLTLASFPIMLIVLLAGLWLLHRRKPKSIIKPIGPFNWKKLFFGVGVWLAILVLSEVVSYLVNPGIYAFNLEFGKWWPFLLIGVLLIPIQTTAEELVFRGYLTQWVGKYTNSLWVLILLPSLLFGMLHITNPEVEKYGFWWMMPGYIGIGIMFSYLSLKTNGLEMAIGVHAINNLYALLITFPESALALPAPIKVLSLNPQEMFLSSMITILLMIGIAHWLKPQWMRGEET